MFDYFFGEEEQEDKSQEESLREQFDNYIEMWLRRVAHKNDRDAGLYIHGLIDGMYLVMSGLIDRNDLPILTKVRQAVQQDYGKMFSCPVKFKG